VAFDPTATLSATVPRLKDVLWITACPEEGHVVLQGTAATTGPRVTISHTWEGRRDLVAVQVTPDAGLGLPPWKAEAPRGILRRVTELVRAGFPVWLDCLCMRQEQMHRAAQMPLLGVIFANSFTLPLGPNGTDLSMAGFSRSLWAMQELYLGDVLLENSAEGLAMLADLSQNAMLTTSTQRILARASAAQLLQSFLQEPSAALLDSVCNRSASELGGNASSISGGIFRRLLGTSPLVEFASLGFILVALLNKPQAWRQKLLKLVVLTARITGAVGRGQPACRGLLENNIPLYAVWWVAWCSWGQPAGLHLDGRLLVSGGVPEAQPAGQPAGLGVRGI
jgi:hypothetical protein